MSEIDPQAFASDLALLLSKLHEWRAYAALPALAATMRARDGDLLITVTEDGTATLDTGSDVLDITSLHPASAG